MGSPKSRAALTRIGHDMRAARLRRRIARAGTSASTIVRLENGDPGVGIGTLADVLVVLGLIERFADLFDARHDDLGLALADEQLPKRGRTFAAAVRHRNRKARHDKAAGSEAVNPEGLAF